MLKVPEAVGVPLTVALLAVVAVTDSPAGRLDTWYPLKGALPPDQVNVWLYGIPATAVKPPLAPMVMVGSATVTVTVAAADVPPGPVAV